MADTRAGSATSLSPDELRGLACVLDAIIPPSPDGRLPGAGVLGVVASVERALQSLPELRVMVTQGLRDLETQARERHARPFSALSSEERDALLAEHGFVFALTLHTYIGYYQHVQVLEALGIEPRPPHPRGYPMPPNDPALLDPVRQRGKRFRNL